MVKDLSSIVRKALIVASAATFAIYSGELNPAYANTKINGPIENTANSSIKELKEYLSEKAKAKEDKDIRNYQNPSEIAREILVKLNECVPSDTLNMSHDRIGGVSEAANNLRSRIDNYSATWNELSTLPSDDEMKKMKLESRLESWQQGVKLFSEKLYSALGSR